MFLGYLAFQSLQILYLILAALIVSMALESVITRLSRFLPRGASIGISYVLLIIFALSGVVLLIPFIVGHISSLFTSIAHRGSSTIQLLETQGLTGLIQESVMPSLWKDSLIEYIQTEGVAQELQALLQSNISSLISTSRNIGGTAGGVLVTAL